jgi:uncharacterized lipoprotein YajG
LFVIDTEEGDMSVEKRLLILATCFVLAACSTTIKTTQQIPQQIRQDIIVKDASVQVADGIDVPADIPGRLQKALLERAAKHGNGTKPVTLKLTITQFHVASIVERFWGGAFVGSNKLDVTVNVVAADGTMLGSYIVQREANPGGYGIYFDQTQSTINDSANGVIAGLYQADEN